jgi:hypothetical protein
MGFSSAGLVEYYKELGPNIIGAEIGVCRGENIRSLLDNCPNIRKIYGIDPWIEYKDNLMITQKMADEWWKTANEILQSYWLDDSVELIRASSLYGARRFAPESLHFVFIDGNHSYSEVCADLETWWPRVKSGGLLSGHDFRPKDIDVRRAVYEFASKNDLTVIETKVIENVQGPCWMIRKEVTK